MRPCPLGTQFAQDLLSLREAAIVHSQGALHLEVRALVDDPFRRPEHRGCGHAIGVQLVGEGQPEVAMLFVIGVAECRVRLGQRGDEFTVVERRP